MARLILNIAVCVFFCAVQAPAQRPPKIITFDAPGAGMSRGSGTVPVSINDAGIIAGHYVTGGWQQNGFVRAADGTITSFIPPASAGTYPTSINSVGDITGGYDDGGRNQGFVRAASGVIATFGVPGAGTGNGQGTLPESINTRGQIVGWYLDANNVFHGFIRDPNGVFTTIDAPGAGANSYQGTEALSINADGVITGFFTGTDAVYHGFIRVQSGSTITFITFDAPGASMSQNYGTIAQSINDRGFVTGHYQDANFMYHGFLRTPRGKIAAIDFPGASLTFANQVNTRGDVTGYYAQGPASSGFFRTAGGTLTAFNVPAAGTGNGGGTLPLGINNNGQITGFYIDSNLVNHGFLLIP